MAIIFLPFTSQLAHFLNRILPDKPKPKEPESLKVRYLDESLYQTPELALEAVGHECMRIGNRVVEMLSAILDFLSQGKKREYELLKTKRREIEQLESMTLEYLRNLNSGDLSPGQSQKLMNLLSVVNHLENMSEFLHVEILQIRKKMESNAIKLDQESLFKLQPMINETVKAFKKTMTALENQDSALAKKVSKMKDHVSETAESFKKEQSLVLLGNKDDAIESYRIEIAMIDILKRVFYHTRRIARRI